MKNTAAGLLLAPVLVLVGLVGLVGAPRDALARRALAAVRACTTIAADAERLACYDRALGVERTERTGKIERSQAAGTGPASPPNSGSTRAARRTSAGEREPPASRETRPARERQTQEPARVEVTVVRVRRAPRTDEVAFITEDGQVWRETDEKRVMFPRPPFRAVITAGSLGGHFLTPEGERVDIHVAQQQ